MLHPSVNKMTLDETNSYSRVILERLIVAQLIKKLLTFYDTKGSLLCSQDDNFCSCPDKILR